MLYSLCVMCPLLCSFVCYVLFERDVKFVWYVYVYFCVVFCLSVMWNLCDTCMCIFVFCLSVMWNLCDTCMCIFCVVFCLSVVRYFVICVFCVLSLTVEPLPPGKTPFAVQLNDNKKKLPMSHLTEVMTVQTCHLTDHRAIQVMPSCRLLLYIGQTVFPTLLLTSDMGSIVPRSDLRYVLTELWPMSQAMESTCASFGA
jgi:hypothetical protein